MKKIALLLFVLVFIFVIGGCSINITIDDNGTDGADVEITDVKSTDTPVVDEAQELTQLKEEIKEAGKLFGVAYLGWIEGDFQTAAAELGNQEYIEELSFIKDIKKFAENEGYRMYAIVPADDSVTLSVCRCEFDDDYMPYAGEELVSANEPVLVRGNMSDTIPNLYVVAEKASQVVEYTPVQSGMDGKLVNSEDEVYDFTPYDKMPEFNMTENNEVID